ncbi:UNVERIFIED_CONTAM: hypothetical protein K2H54_012071 [Gekko kuhli]
MAPGKPADDSTPASLTPEEAPLTRNDLHELKDSLLKDMATLVTGLLKLVRSSLSELVKEVKEASKMAETALEMALTLQGEDCSN